MQTVLYEKKWELSSTAEVSQDVILPDYLPEIRRIVGVQAQTTVDGKYLSGEEMEVDGGVTYAVLYTTPEGDLAQISENTSYTGRLPMKEPSMGTEDVLLWAAAENVVCRVQSPRKMTLSCRVRLGATAQKGEDGSLHVEGGGAEKRQVRRRVTDIPTACLSEVRRTGETEGELREREGMKLIGASGSLCVGDVRLIPGDGGRGRTASVKGDAMVTALFLAPEGAYVVSRSRSPFEETVPLGEEIEGEEELRAAVFGKVVLIELEGTEGGAYPWKMEYDLDLALMRCRTATVTTDAYLADGEDQLAKKTFRVATPGAAMNGRLTLSGSARLRPDCHYVYGWGTATVDKAEFLPGGRMQMSGNVKLSLVTVGGGEFFCDEVVLPLRYMGDAIAGAGEGEAYCGRMQAEVTEISARPEGDTMSLTVEVALAASLLTEQERSLAVSLTPVEGKGSSLPRKNCLTVYVPDEKESAWDVEKRFRLGTEARKEGDVYVI